MAKIVKDAMTHQITMSLVRAGVTLGGLSGGGAHQSKKRPSRSAAKAGWRKEVGQY